MKNRQKKEAVTLYEKGNSLKEIAAATGLSVSTVWRTIKNSQIEMRPNKPPVKFDRELQERMVKLYADPNNTIRYVMDTVGIKSEQTLYRLLRENGVELRKNN
jgi:predicted DNA-binding transcriptional regulator AlpA